MDRRSFLQLAAVSPLIAGQEDHPEYRVVTRHEASRRPAMPGPYPGRMVRVHGEKSIDSATERVDKEVVRRMLSAGICSLTGAARARDAWARFITPKDVVGIKLNCSGAPRIQSSPEIVACIAEDLIALGVPAKQIYVYDRFDNQLASVGYQKYLPPEVQIFASEKGRDRTSGYDPNIYVEADFPGEDDKRSCLIRQISGTFTKIINIPNAKEHQASGVTGAVKNIAYGSFSNVARAHPIPKTWLLSFVGTLAAVEPLPSLTVLHIMDGLRGVWHAGPFSNDPKFRFFPKQIWFGTDPVAMDRQLIDLIEEKRKAEGAVSIFDQSREHLGDNRNPNFNRYIREPGHVEYAGRLGLGVFDKSKIKVNAIEV